jgi:hypothetical protein
MKRLLPLILAGLMATSGFAQSAEEPVLDLFMTGDMEDLSEFQWEKRPILVFADSENDPAFIEQMDLLRERVDDLLVRDVIVLTDTDPAARNPLRLRMRPHGFMLVLVGKDGQVELRKPLPWSVREISRSIDKMPMRQREIREGKERPGTVVQ